MSVSTRTAFRRLTVVALGVALCAGCTASGEEPPQPEASSSASSAPSTPEPSPSPIDIPPYDGTSAPQMPADMASDGHLGARAAATYFIDARHWALISNDPTGLLDICDPASIYCSGTIDTVRANSASGAIVEGGRATLTIVSVHPPTTEVPFFEVLGSLDEEPMTKLGAGGAVEFTTEGQAALPFVIFLEHQAEDGWIIRGADVDTR